MGFEETDLDRAFQGHEQRMRDQEWRRSRGTALDGPYNSGLLINPSERASDRQGATTSPSIDVAAMVGGAVQLASLVARRRAEAAERRAANDAQAATRAWRADPSGVYDQRWWDGFQWTPLVKDHAGTIIEAAVISPRPDRPPLPPPSWQPDPTGRFVHRWWDGVRWSQMVTRRDGQTQPDPELIPLDPNLVAVDASYWAPDPFRRFSERLWSGSSWTSEVRSHPDDRGEDPLVFDSLLLDAALWPERESAIHEGAGNSLITVDQAFGGEPNVGCIAQMRFSASDGARVTLLDETGTAVGALAEPSRDYSGSRVVPGGVCFLEVETTGPWRIEFGELLKTIRYLPSRGHLGCAGDEVVVWLGPAAVAEIWSERPDTLEVCTADAVGRRSLQIVRAETCAMVALPSMETIEVRAQGQWALRIAHQA